SALVRGRGRPARGKRFPGGGARPRLRRRPPRRDEASPPRPPTRRTPRDPARGGRAPEASPGAAGASRRSRASRARGPRAAAPRAPRGSRRRCRWPRFSVGSSSNGVGYVATLAEGPARVPSRRMSGQFDHGPTEGGPYGDLEPSWTRRRVVFLAISGVALVALLLATRTVLLPFVLALIIAYVLTPLVGFCEQRLRMPRSLAILVVYAVTFGGIYSGVAAMAPRLYEETVHLTRDAPALLRQAAARWGPQVDAWVNAYLERGGPERGAAPEGAAEPEAPASEPAIAVLQRPDGSLAIELRSGVDVIQENPRRWRISAREEIPPEGFSVSALVDESLERFINYVK